MSAEWMTEESVAEWLGVPLEIVKEAVRDGELPALALKGFIRINRGEVVKLVAASPKKRNEQTGSDTQSAPRTNGLPMPRGMAWMSELARRDDFTYVWPDKTHEDYSNVLGASISLPGKKAEVKVGEAKRHDRGRLTVFISGTATAEFVETADHQGWASVIKPDSRGILGMSDTPPVLYKNARIRPYREATGWSRSGVPKGAALLIDRDDFHSAVHHAVARWLARRGLPLVSAEQ